MQALYAPEVAVELANAHDWYENRAVGLSDEFLRMAYMACFTHRGILSS